MTHLQPLTPENVQYAAQVMSKNGMSDEEVGAALRLHYHDRNKEQSRVWLVARNDGKKQGVVMLVPHGPWHEGLHPAEGADEARGHLRFYGTPDDTKVVDAAASEARDRGWKVIIPPEYSRCVESALTETYGQMDVHEVWP